MDFANNHISSLAMTRLYEKKYVYIIALMLHRVFMFSNKLNLQRAKITKLSIHPLSHPLPSYWIYELTNISIRWQPTLMTIFHCHNIHVCIFYINYEKKIVVFFFDSERSFSSCCFIIFLLDEKLSVSSQR